MWRVSILTIFPEMFPGPLGASLAGKALAAGLWTLEAVDIRAHATDKHRSVDDTPAGGGPGMVMRPDVLARAVDALAPAGDPRPRLVMSPRGVPLTQARVAALANGPGAVVLCGRFEGIDERLIEAYPLLDELPDCVRAIGENKQQSLVVLLGEFIEAIDDPRAGEDAVLDQALVVVVGGRDRLPLGLAGSPQ